MTLTFGSLFAGIGGFDLGLERAGMTCRWQVEIDPFCQKVLAKHWPDVERFSDVRECGEHNLPAVDLICGGFPCQPFSEAGEQRGEQDDRNLWPEMRRVVAELRPYWVVAENVPGIRNVYWDTVLSDLESLDYTTATIDLPAVAFGAPHIRHRLFVIAHTNRPNKRGREQPQRRPYWRDSHLARNGTEGAVAHFIGHRLQRKQPVRSTPPPTIGICNWWRSEPSVASVVYGVSPDMDRLRALGNAVVPQVAEWIGHRIMEVERAETT